MKFIDTKRARSTGAFVTVYDFRDEPVEEFTWGAECEEHGWIVMTLTRREAHADASTPEDWCPGCE